MCEGESDSATESERQRVCVTSREVLVTRSLREAAYIATVLVSTKVSGCVQGYLAGKKTLPPLGMP